MKFRDPFPKLAGAKGEKTTSPCWIRAGKTPIGRGPVVFTTTGRLLDVVLAKLPLEELDRD